MVWTVREITEGLWFGYADSFERVWATAMCTQAPTRVH